MVDTSVVRIRARVRRIAAFEDHAHHQVALAEDAANISIEDQMD